MPDEILICQQIRSYTAREFKYKALDVRERLLRLGRERHAPRWEEGFSVWILKRPSPQCLTASDLCIAENARSYIAQWRDCLVEELGRARPQ